MFGTAEAEKQLAIDTLLGEGEPGRMVVVIDKDTIKLWKKAGRGRIGWETSDFAEAVERVNRGSLLLDEQKPKWVYGVLPAKLDMSDAHLCIIGQSYGNYDAVAIPFGMEVVEGMTEDEEEKLDADLTETAIRHGFLTEHPNPPDIPYGVLDRVWVYMLTERHNREGEPLLLAMPERN